MTTENVEIPTGLDEALGVVAGSAKSRGKRIEVLKAGTLKHIDTVATGAAVLVKRDLDTIEDLDHEADQLDEIGAIADALMAAAMKAGVNLADDEEDDDLDEDPLIDFIYTREQLEDLSNEELARLANHYDYVTTTGPTTRSEIIDFIVTAQSAWCNENGVDDPNAVPEEDTTLFERFYNATQLTDMSDVDLTRLAAFYGYTGPFMRSTLVVFIVTQQTLVCMYFGHPELDPSRVETSTDGSDFWSQFNPLHWTGWQWVFAVVMACIGFVVAMMFKDFPDLHQTWWKGAFSFFLVTIGTVFGFFAGGFFGTYVDEMGE
jgi:hypothetical protein